MSELKSLLAEIQAKLQQQSGGSPTAAPESAQERLKREIVETRLGGDSRIYARWLANNRDFANYRLKLIEAEGKQRKPGTDTATVLTAVDVANRGGFVSRDGKPTAGTRAATGLAKAVSGHFAPHA